MKKRFKNKIYLTAVSAFVYKVYSGVIAPKYGLPHVSPGDWNLAIDLLAYGAIGYGIHTSFEDSEQ